MGILSTIMSRVKLDPIDAAIVAVVLLAVVNVLVELWSWLSAAP